MITRIVKMIFHEEHIARFQQLFAEKKDHIRHFEGCLHLELWQDKYHPRTFFTYSIWQSEEALNKYRHSDFFNETWTETKKLFAGKPEAWTMEENFFND